MKVRTSENPHFFQEKLFQRLSAYSLQGLLMNDQHEFTTALEAVEYGEGDDKHRLPFKVETVQAQYLLAREAGIPLYYLCYIDGMYRIYEAVERNGQVELKTTWNLEEEGFIQWWGERKQTIQKKPLRNGGEQRIGQTIFDRVLRKHGYEWGGNIDGFVVDWKEKKIRFLIDNISVRRKDLQDEPSHYFHSPNPKHGPRYEGWYGAVKLSSRLQIPHALFTIDKNNPTIEHIGFALIEKLSPEGLFYADQIRPDQNILEGMDHIVSTVQKRARTAVPPILVEKK